MIVACDAIVVYSLYRCLFLFLYLLLFSSLMCVALSFHSSLNSALPFPHPAPLQQASSPQVALRDPPCSIPHRVIPLTTDHKPNLPSERARIIKAGGRVLAHESCPDIHRVYQKGIMLPGLAVARSVGDIASRSIGVSDEPALQEYTIRDDDLFLVLATDGLWEFVSNAEVAAIVLANVGNLQHAVDVLLATARARYLSRTSNSYVDDTTVVIALLNDNFGPCNKASSAATTTTTSTSTSSASNATVAMGSSNSNNSNSATSNESAMSPS